jgi:hypothetical protein
MQGPIESLPLIGIDALIVGGVAFVLTGIGFALRKLSRPLGRSAQGSRTPVTR